MKPVISHEPYTDTFKLHLTHGRTAVFERSELEVLGRLITLSLAPYDERMREPELYTYTGEGRAL